MSFQKIYGLYWPNYPADIFTPSCLDPHWPAGHLRSKHISYSWYDGKSSYDGTPSYDDFPSYENFLFGIWWIAIILTIQCMMELHHIMMLIHHKLYDSYKLYYCREEKHFIKEKISWTTQWHPPTYTITTKLVWSWHGCAWAGYMMSRFLLNCCHHRFSQASQPEGFPNESSRKVFS